jgi:hypothetical protein
MSLVLASVLTASLEIPLCRYDDTLVADVRSAADLARRTIAPFLDGVAINPRTTPDARTLTVEIVRTPGGCGVGDPPDELSVTDGVCFAERGAPRIRCSAEALNALTEGDRKGGRASSALLYVIAHEVGHVQQGKAGEFQGKRAVVHLQRTEHAKWLELRQLCRAPNVDLLALEEQADLQALTVLERAVDLDRYRDPMLSPQSAIYMFVERLRLAAHALTTWENAPQGDLRRPTALTVQTFDPTPENIERTSRRLLCQVRTSTNGILGLPNAPDTHPDEPSRLAAISTTLQRKAKQHPVGRLGRPREVPDITQIDETLIPTIGAIAAMWDVDQKQFYGGLWPHLCTSYLNSQAWPECNGASLGDGTPECPLFLGIFDQETSGPAPVPRIVSAHPFVYVDGNRAFHFKRGLWNDAHVSPDDVEGTWLGHIDGRLFATLYLATAGRSVTVELTKDGAKSAGAWRKPGCERLRSGFGLAPARDGRVIGVTTSQRATLEVARFSPDLSDVQDVMSPDDLQAERHGLGPVLSCAAGPTSNGAACVDVEGAIFDPFSKTSPVVGRVAFSDRLRRSRTTRGHIGALMDGIYVLAWDAEGWEAHVLRQGKSIPLRSELGAVSSIELIVAADRVEALVNGRTTTLTEVAPAPSAR